MLQIREPIVSIHVLSGPNLHSAKSNKPCLTQCHSPQLPRALASGDRLVLTGIMHLADVLGFKGRIRESWAAAQSSHGSYLPWISYICPSDTYSVKCHMLDFENIEVEFLECAGVKIGKNPIPGGLPTSVRKHHNGYTVSLRFQCCKSYDGLSFAAEEDRQASMTSRTRQRFPQRKPDSQVAF